MKANKKDDKIFRKFKHKYALIFSNKELLNKAINSFDKKCALIGFTLSFFENQIGYEKLYNSISKYTSEWLGFFSSFYDDQDIKQTYEMLSLNPIIDLEKIIQCFDCFNALISKILQFIEYMNLKLNIETKGIKEILKNTFGFILYNSIDCKVKYSFEEILTDTQYGVKYLVILNNTKLFSISKQSICQYCGNKINDLITLLLGLSNDLNYDK